MTIDFIFVVLFWVSFVILGFDVVMGLFISLCRFIDKERAEPWRDSSLWNEVSQINQIVSMIFCYLVSPTVQGYFN